jgi:hypothetical protein
MAIEIFTTSGKSYFFPEAKISSEDKETLLLIYVDPSGKQRTATFLKVCLTGWTVENS